MFLDEAGSSTEPAADGLVVLKGNRQRRPDATTYAFSEWAFAGSEITVGPRSRPGVGLSGSAVIRVHVRPPSALQKSPVSSIPFPWLTARKPLSPNGAIAPPPRPVYEPWNGPLVGPYVGPANPRPLTSGPMLNSVRTLWAVVARVTPT